METRNLRRGTQSGKQAEEDVFNALEANYKKRAVFLGGNFPRFDMAVIEKNGTGRVCFIQVKQESSAQPGYVISKAKWLKLKCENPLLFVVINENRKTFWVASLAKIQTNKKKYIHSLGSKTDKNGSLKAKPIGQELIQIKKLRKELQVHVDKELKRKFVF
jgi:hypothetical protein